ncbi:MAG: hypothetical protein SGILL_007753 [Bacillariaceae sp.]
MKKQVSFDHSVSIRHFPYVAGDNPSVFDGPPLSLDWEHCEETIAQVQDKEDPTKSDTAQCENKKCNDTSTKASGGGEEEEGNVRRLSPQERQDILEAWGVPHREIRQATRLADKGRMHRQFTRESVQLTPGQEVLNEWFEKVFRGFRNATYGKKSKERERQLLAAWRKNSDDVDLKKKITADRLSNMTDQTAMDETCCMDGTFGPESV